jgi:hypothetical protein
MKRIAFALLFCLVAAGIAFADENTNVPAQFTFTTYIGDPPAGVKPLWKWTVGYKEKTYTMNVVKTQLLSESVMPQDIDEWVLPYKPNFNLQGDDKAISAFTSTKPGEKVAVSGWVRVNDPTRNLTLNNVVPAPDAK